MADRKIIWSGTAKRKLFAILEFFIERNKSSTYSIKLYNTFQKQIQIVNSNPDIGIKTDIKDVRGLIVLDYTLFYEITAENIIIHTVWDNRQNPDDLKIK